MILLNCLSTVTRGKYNLSNFTHHHFAFTHNLRNVFCHYSTAEYNINFTQNDVQVRFYSTV